MTLSVSKHGRESRSINAMATKCKVHPRYQALRKPRASCEACWRMWIEQQDSLAFIQEAKEQVEREERGRRSYLVQYNSARNRM